MSHDATGTSPDATPALRGRPAIGVLSNGTSAPETLHAILRAQRHGYDVLVASDADAGETLDYAGQLGAEVVPSGATYPDDDRLRRELTRAARERGFPGLIVHHPSAERIDYDRSVARLAESDRYAVQARTALEPETGSDGVLVAIPAFNEEATIASVVREARTHADCVVVVDDGSEDDTARLAEEAGAIVVRHERNLGYGAALKTAFREAKLRNAEHLVVLDGDGQHNPTDVSKFVSVQRETGADVVTGNRFGEEATSNTPLYRRVGLEVINGMTNLCLSVLRSDVAVRDTQSGFRAYGRRAIQSIADDDGIGSGMNASLDILFHAHRNGYTVEEVDTTIEYEVEQANSLDPVHHGYVLVRAVLQTMEYERPLTVLGVPGVLSTLLGFWVGHLALSAYVRSSVVPFELTIGAAFLVFVGFLVALTAVVLHALNGYFHDTSKPPDGSDRHGDHVVKSR